MTIKAILFDFDGVVVDSVNVKTEAFSELFSNEREHLQSIINFHLANGGMSRYIKFEIIYRDILKKPFSNELSQELGKKFSQLVLQKVIDCAYIPGALEFLQKYFNQVLLFIASGTPQDELESIITKRGLNKYFKEIHGTPRTKPDIIRDILKRYNLKSEEMPFIGDAINDYRAALETNLPFYGYAPTGKGGFPPNVQIIRSFQELENRLFNK